MRKSPGCQNCIGVSFAQVNAEALPYDIAHIWSWFFLLSSLLPTLWERTAYDRTVGPRPMKHWWKWFGRCLGATWQKKIKEVPLESNTGERVSWPGAEHTRCPQTQGILMSSDAIALSNRHLWLSTVNLNRMVSHQISHVAVGATFCATASILQSFIVLRFVFLLAGDGKNVDLAWLSSLSASRRWDHQTVMWVTYMLVLLISWLYHMVGLHTSTLLS